MSSADGVSKTLKGAPTITWRCVPFAELSVWDLQRIHRARQQVFVVEQRCAFLDADEHDADAVHLTGAAVDGDELLAYARLMAPGGKYREASIGRVMTAAAARGSGLGRILVARALQSADRLWPGVAIRIGAQARLDAFYAGFGFVSDGDPYDEDGIAHLEMVLTR